MSERWLAEFHPPLRVLLGPGPSNVHPRVLQAIASPVVGHLDPEFFRAMDDVVELLRRVFKTRNHLTLPISGTGSAGMEAALVNTLEPGDAIVIGVNGYFGERMVEMASRCGAKVIPVKEEWGRIVQHEAVEKELKAQRVKVLAVVHAETSTGILQPIAELGRLAHQYGALFLVDAVTSLAGCDVATDDWGIDVCYSGTQKCLSCPPGLAPITLSERALEAIKGRNAKVQSWYLDLSLIESYWSSGRAYHHTAPISMIYALREALRLVMEEGLEARFARHRRNGQALRAGLKAMGLKLLAQPEFAADTLTTVCIPEGVQDMPLRQALLNELGIEIGGGLGPLRGKIWRIGLMGESSTGRNVLAVLLALEQLLRRQGFEVAEGAGISAAQKALT